MTNEKYEQMLIDMVEVLKEKKSELFFKDLELDRLRTQLKHAEERIKEFETKELESLDIETIEIKMAGE